MNKFVLDIGCNEGFLDMEIAMRFFPKKIYAIDIDYSLIKNARKTLHRAVSKEKGYSEAFKGEDIENSRGEESLEKEEMVREV
jgi:tRNA1(Val) A37 N6-methylase TrmN6